jgi:hypothetical protein
VLSSALIAAFLFWVAAMLVLAWRLWVAPENEGA